MASRASWMALMGVLALALLNACGGNDGSDPAVNGEPQALALTLADNACRFAGPASVPAGSLAIDVENQSSAAGRFELMRLAEGATADDLAAHVGEQQRRIAEGLAPGGKPSFASIVDSVGVVARWNSTLSGDVTAGAYGLVCSIGLPPKAVYLATTLEVTE